MFEMNRARPEESHHGTPAEIQGSKIKDHDSSTQTRPAEPRAKGLKSINMKRALIARILVAAMAFGAGPALSASPTGEASAFIRGFIGEATRVLATKDAGLAEREAKLQAILYGHFDVRVIGRFALGRYWRQASAEQQRDYLDLFGRYIVKTYSAKFGQFSGEQLEIISETPLTNKIDVLVNTRIERPSGPPIKAIWRVRSRKDTRQIIDVMIEGTSMAFTQRQQFASVVHQNGFEGLLETLRTKLSTSR